MKFSGLATSLVLGCSILVHDTSFAADCSEILRQASANIRISKSAESSVVSKYYNHCKKDFGSYSDSILGSIQVEVLGFGGGQASFDRQRAVQQLNHWCKENKEFAENNKNLFEESREIYGPAVNAWESCVALEKDEIQVDISILPNNEIIDVGLRYTGPAGQGVEYFGVKANNFDCTQSIPGGVVASEDNPVKITNEAINISCERRPSEVVERQSGEYEVKRWGRVTIQTASKPFQFYFAQEENATIPTEKIISLRSDIRKLRRKVEELEKSTSEQINKVDQTLGETRGQVNVNNSQIQSVSSDLKAEKLGNRFIIMEQGANCPPGWKPRALYAALLHATDAQNRLGNPLPRAVKIEPSYVYDNFMMCFRP